MYFINIKQLKQDIINRDFTEKDRFIYAFITIIGYSILSESYILSANPTTLLFSDYIYNILMVFITAIGTYYLYLANGGRDGEDFLGRYFSIVWVVSIRILLPYIVVLFILTSESIESGIMVLDGVFSMMLFLYTFVLYYCSYGHFLLVNKKADNREWIFNLSISKALLLLSVVLGAILTIFLDRESTVFIDYDYFFLFCILLGIGLTLSNQRSSIWLTIVLILSLTLVGSFIGTEGYVTTIDGEDGLTSVFVASYSLVSQNTLIGIGALVLGIVIKRFGIVINRLWVNGLTIIWGILFGFILFNITMLLEYAYIMIMSILIFWIVGIAEKLIRKGSNQ